MRHVHAALALVLFVVAIEGQMASDAQDLRRASQALLDAVAPGDVAVWDKYLDPSIVHIDENGVRRSKSELLRELQPLPQGLTGRLAIQSFQLSVHEPIAIVSVEVQESLDYFGQPLHSRFRSLDIWKRTADGWRLIAQHTAAVLRDPPAIALPMKTLCGYNGRYALTGEITSVIECTQGGITSTRTGRPQVVFHPEVLDVFFTAGQPRTRRIFQRDAAGRITSFVDRREGEDIRWRRLE